MSDFHIPGYSGHVPTISDKLGKSYRFASAEAIQHAKYEEAASPAAFIPPPRAVFPTRYVIFALFAIFLTS
jgi:hypothetical protein